jgi:hypothetical protein
MAYNYNDVLTTYTCLLHTIPHYCFRTVISSINKLLVYVFFPKLHLKSNTRQKPILRREDEQLWLDAVLIPALLQVVDDSAIVAQYPASKAVAKWGVTAISNETFRRKEGLREQQLAYALQSQHLDLLWTAVLNCIAEDLGCSRFKGATLFAHAKNSKLATITDSLPAAYRQWQETWEETANPEFYSRDRTYVDLAKLVTSLDFASRFGNVPAGFKLETYLWKRCCLNAYTRTRI